MIKNYYFEVLFFDMILTLTGSCFARDNLFIGMILCAAIDSIVRSGGGWVVMTPANYFV